MAPDGRKRSAPICTHDGRLGDISLDNLSPGMMSREDRERQASDVDPLLMEAESSLVPVTPNHQEAQYDDGAGPDNRATSNTRLPSSWLPFTLRLPFLVFSVVLAALLGVATLAITLYSSTHGGLGPDSNSSALLFGWRFTPTLFAVLYTIIVTAILLDTRRTEVFARLTRPRGAAAAASLCWPSRNWWNDPTDATSTKKHGFRSWALFWASISNMLASFAISPLSAGLLAPANVRLSQTVPFRFYDVPSPVSYPTDYNDTLILQTVAGAILNKSTSAWITDDYYISPFWPSASTSPPLGSSFTGFASQQWTALTTVYHMDLNCSSVTLRSQRNLTGAELFAGGICDVAGEQCKNTTLAGSAFYAALSLATEDGCEISYFDQLGAWYYTQPNAMTLGGGWWTNTTNNLTMQTSAVLESYATVWPVSNSSSACGSRSYLSWNTPWTPSESLSMQGYVCSTGYTSANVSVTVTISDKSTKAVFDTADFNASQRAMDPDEFSLQQLDQSFFLSNWPAHFPDSSWFAGPSLAVAAIYNNNTETMVHSAANIVQDAQKLQRQWFGQMLMYVQGKGPGDSTTTRTATLSSSENKIVVVESIGLVVGVLFLVSSALLVLVLVKTRLSGRPLGLQSDPASLAAAMSLITSQESVSVRQSLRGLDRQPQPVINEQLSDTWFGLHDGSLRAMELDPLMMQNGESPALERKPLASPGKHAPPTVLRPWVGMLLLLALAGLIAAILVLFRISQTGILSQRALVFQADVSIASIATTLAPYSIIPTLFAIGLKLWYASVEGTMRMLQPFSSLAEGPADVANSILVEYANTLPLFGVLKALRHSHWILAVALVGALGTEIFTVTISALWDRETRPSVHDLILNRQYELRQVPAVIATHYNGDMGESYTTPSTTSLLDTVFGNNYLTGWLYGALLETMNATTTPPWTQDEWSFAPVDFSLSSENIMKYSTNQGTPISSLGFNVTSDTQAVRARLDCQPFAGLDNGSLWMKTWHFRTDKGWNTTNSPPGLDVGYELQTGFTPANSTAGDYLDYLVLPRGSPQCCANVTGSVTGEAAIGYATSSSITSASVREGLFIKWITGFPLEQLYYDSNSSIPNPHWIWAEKPQAQALVCSPVIEQANATVTVDIATGTVLNYTINGPPQNATGAWTDNNVGRDPYFAVPANETSRGWAYNMTTSYGWLFWNGMIYSSNIKDAATQLIFVASQNAQDHVFNVQERGLNADFLSYSMFLLAGDGTGNKKALLNETTLKETASRAFGVYFKHFASTTATATGELNAFQSIGATLPADLPQPSAGGGQQNWYNASVAVAADMLAPQTPDALVHVPVDALVVAPVAAWLCVGVLSMLCIVVAAVYGVLHRSRRRGSAGWLPRDAGTLASVLAFVYDSAALLEWVQENQDGGKSWQHFGGLGGGVRPKARLGDFVKADGTPGWGVELSQPVDVDEPK